MRIRPPHLAAGTTAGIAILAASTISLSNQHPHPPHAGLYFVGAIVGAIIATAFAVSGVIVNYLGGQTKDLLAAQAKLSQESEERAAALQAEADERCDAVINAVLDALRAPGATINDIHHMVVGISDGQTRHVDLTKTNLEATRGLLKAAPNMNSPDTTGPQTPLTVV